MFKDTINHFSLKFSEKILRFIIYGRTGNFEKKFKEPDLLHH